ncbi:YtzI protein [Cytobacillus praedii]|uniref:YtzI protein n=1 Tax=Cytobacillus praedii TaxID=1742358 RepID=UPI002E1D8F3F|nr:YtzI protein [Cytobacillus praedii]
MVAILAISVIIIAIVIFLSVITTSKAYTYKHTVDTIDENPYKNEHTAEQENDKKTS